MFFKFLCFDIKNGILRPWKKLLLAGSMLILFFLFHFLLVYDGNQSLAAQGEAGITFTAGDLIASVLAGMAPFDPASNEVFLFPGLWLLFFLFLCFAVLLYPVENLNGIGQTMLMLSQKRWIWWLSKCGWCALFVLIYFAGFYFLAVLFSLLSGGELTLNISEYLPGILGGRGEFRNPPWHMIPFLIAAPVTTYSLVLAQMTLTLWVRPIFAYLISCVYWLASSYFLSPLLTGNYVMLVRSGVLLHDGLETLDGVLVAVVLCLFCVSIGCWRISHMDILTFE